MAHSKHLNKEEKNVVLAYRRAFKRALREAELDMRRVQYQQNGNAPDYEFNTFLDADYNTWFSMSLDDKILEIRKIDVKIVTLVQTEAEMMEVMSRLEEDAAFEA